MLEDDEPHWTDAFFLFFGLKDRGDEVILAVRLLAFVVGIGTGDDGIGNVDGSFSIDDDEALVISIEEESEVPFVPEQ